MREPKDPREVERCIFCGKSAKLVDRLIAGPPNIYICNECVELCHSILSEDDRRRVWAWIDHLKRWETDPFVRTHSKKLGEGDAYVLQTSTDVRIFFTLSETTITVLDVARKATIVSGTLGR